MTASRSDTGNVTTDPSGIRSSGGRCSMLNVADPSSRVTFPITAPSRIGCATTSHSLRLAAAVRNVSGKSNQTRRPSPAQLTDGAILKPESTMQFRQFGPKSAEFIQPGGRCILRPMPFLRPPPQDQSALLRCNRGDRVLIPPGRRRNALDSASAKPARFGFAPLG
jgi:hypothetical protein